MRTYRYHVVDVFTEIPFAGNMLAVFPDASGLDDGDMQSIARELNLSETSFVFPPATGSDALARLRIFTPATEVPFAGHPTIGTAYVLALLGRVPAGARDFALDEEIGSVPLRLERREHPFFAWLRTPPIVVDATLDRDECAAILGLEKRDLLGDYPAQIVSAGNPFLYVALRDASSVDRATLDARAFAALVPKPVATGIFPFAPTPGNTFYSRMFAPLAGVPEDPATGSATGPLGVYLLEHGLIARRDGERFINEQGVRMKRRSLVHGIVRLGADGTLMAIDVGGSAVKTSDATMTLPTAHCES